MISFSLESYPPSSPPCYETFYYSSRFVHPLSKAKRILVIQFRIPVRPVTTRWMWVVDFVWNIWFHQSHAEAEDRVVSKDNLPVSHTHHCAGNLDLRRSKMSSHSPVNDRQCIKAYKTHNSNASLTPALRCQKCTWGIWTPTYQKSRPYVSCRIPLPSPSWLVSYHNASIYLLSRFVAPSNIHSSQF